MENSNGASDPVPVSDDEDETHANRSPISQGTGEEENGAEPSNCSESPSDLASNNEEYDTPGVKQVEESDEDQQIDNVSLENGEDEHENRVDQDNTNVNEDVSENEDEEVEQTISAYNNGTVPLSYDNSINDDVHTKDIENVSASGSPSTSPRECIDVDSISMEMNEYIEVNRINWAELEEVNDLWAICDAISAAHSGLPDSLLKEAFFHVLQNHLSKHWNSWIRQHLELLLRLWKREVQTEKPIERPTKFISSSVEYEAPPVKKRRVKNKKTQLMRLMGIGEILEQERVKFATEQGDFDVEEDEHGNFSIGGQELSFESWGEINRIQDDDIVHYPVLPPKQKRPRSKAHAKPKAVPSSVIPTSFKPELVSSALGSTIQSAVTAPSSSLPSKTNNYKEFEKEKKKIEKDEGELSESDDDDGHTDSTSTSGSEDLQLASTASRHKRKRRREHERKQGQQSNGGMSEARQQQITQFIVNFMGGNGNSANPSTK